ncbi:MAG: DNA polymerase/3'-5' exonuclease PolX [Chromatiales bacterium]|jgi:DNA polymerase (family 10)
MPIHNSEIAERFETLADLLELEGANPFRVRAYRNAARTIRGYGKAMADLVKAGEDLSKLPDIGKDLAAKIAEMVRTGKLEALEEVQHRVPRALSELMRLQGLGPKRVKTLYDTLNIRSIEDLKRAARSGQIRELPGFGEKTEAMIMSRLAHFAGTKRRTPLPEAEEIVTPLVEHLKKSPGVKQVTVAGSFRRRRETVGDLDILVTAKKGSPVMQRFVDYDEVEETISQGDTRATVRLRSGLSVDLRVVAEVSYGSALMYFTGSKAHNIALRTIAVKKGYKVNEYGMFRDEKRVAGKTETEIYKRLGLRYVEPELREDRGELEAARKKRLPELITLDDIRGDLHCHSKASDGHDDIEAMARAAKALGYKYLSINDHSHHVTVAHGLDEKRLCRQLEAIDRLNERLEGIAVLKSIEVDILEDGSLDLGDEVLAQLDFTVCAVHYKMDLSQKRQTERILRAMDNPYFHILAHPSGRLINEREPYAIDMERIMDAARERGCALEVNAQPSRLDLTDTHCRMAKELGVKIVISTDAHSTRDLELMCYGIGQARRGWLEADDVLNTLSLKALRKALKRH